MKSHCRLVQNLQKLKKYRQNTKLVITRNQKKLFVISGLNVNPKTNHTIFF